MIRKTSSPFMGTLLGTLVLVMAFAVISVKADDGMKKDMMGEKPMMKGSDSMIAGTADMINKPMTKEPDSMMDEGKMMDDKPMMKKSDNMMGSTGQMMNGSENMKDGGGKMMK